MTHTQKIIDAICTPPLRERNRALTAIDRVNDPVILHKALIEAKGDWRRAALYRRLAWLQVQKETDLIL